MARVDARLWAYWLNLGMVEFITEVHLNQKFEVTGIQAKTGPAGALGVLRIWTR